MKFYVFSVLDLKQGYFWQYVERDCHRIYSDSAIPVNWPAGDLPEV